MCKWCRPLPKIKLQTFLQGLAVEPSAYYATRTFPSSRLYLPGISGVLCFVLRWLRLRLRTKRNLHYSLPTKGDFAWKEPRKTIRVLCPYTTRGGCIEIVFLREEDSIQHEIIHASCRSMAASPTRKLCSLTYFLLAEFRCFTAYGRAVL